MTLDCKKHKAFQKPSGFEKMPHTLNLLYTLLYIRPNFSRISIHNWCKIQQNTVHTTQNQGLELSLILELCSRHWTLHNCGIVINYIWIIIIWVVIYEVLTQINQIELVGLKSACD